MTDRLYYHDSYLREFRARVVKRSEDGRLLYLDRTAFYPTSGGQPHDTGSIEGVPIMDVIDEEDCIAHCATAPVEATEVSCTVDWVRRFDHMQQHSGQHLLSAVFIEQFGIETCSFHLGEAVSTLDLEVPSIDMDKVIAAERRANEAVWENRPIVVTYEEAHAAGDLRKPTGRVGTLRVVSIHGLDRIACGGTHVHLTGEIGPVLIRRLEKIRSTTRVEFLCGGRAVRRARADYGLLTRTAQAFTTSVDELPDVAGGQLAAVHDAEKMRRKLESELAQYQGRELYDSTAPGADGVRRTVRRLAKRSMEEVRALAQSFTAQPKAIFIGAIEQPASVLFAVSADLGVDASQALQPLVTQAGGRGGGSARMAQGSVPSVEALEAVVRSLNA
jgi:alanyl-tRNA synthetase